MKKTTRLTLAAAFVGVGIPLTDTIAQETSRSGLEEIMVTAQRRSENLQKVPISVKAITADALKASGVTTMNTFYQSVPGLQMNQNLFAAQPFIRGVGSQNIAAGDEAAVITYVDGVYLPTAQGNLFSFNNIERIEVLKGPQGTLFGRNSVGGLINITTRDPQAKPSFEGSVDYGNYDTWEAAGYVTGGTQRVAADLAAYIIKQGKGFGHNILTGAEVNKRNEWAMRSKTVFNLSDDDRIIFSADYDSKTSDYGFSRNNIPGAYLTGGTPFRGSRYDLQQDKPSNIPYADAWGANIRYVRDLGWGSLTALSAYRRYQANFSYDVDTTPLNFVTQAPQNRQKDHSFQNEVFLTGTSGRFDWTVGGIALNLSASYAPLAVSSALIPSVNYFQFGTINTESYAGYGQVTYALTPTTKVTGGIRYTIDRRDLTGYTLAAPGNPAGPPGTQIASPRPVFKTYTQPTWRVAVDQQLGDNVLVYASYNRGYKSGVFSILAPTQTPLNPETLDAYEVGVKSEFFDHTLRLNASAFHYNYKNMQLQRLVVASYQLFNAASSRINGVDLDMEYAPPLPKGNLTLSAGLSFLDAKYSSFPEGPIGIPNPPAAGGVSLVLGNLEGNEMINAPKWTANFTLNYTIDVGPGELGLSGSFYHNSGFSFTTDDRLKQASYNLVNATASYAFGSAHQYRVRVWGKNLTNTDYYIFQGSQSFGDYGIAGFPRLFGVGVDVKF